MKSNYVWYLCLCAVFQRAVKVFCSEDEYRLLNDRFRGYNSLVRPVPQGKNDTVIIVSFSMQFYLLISVDEKNQIMHTNVWLTLVWEDFQMKWQPADYAGIKTIRVTPSKVWLPDIVLFNNADGQYEVSFYSNVVVSYDGSMLWVPPAIYKSYCIMDVEHFPYDEQHCSMIFGSWTFKESEVLLEYNRGMVGVDMNEYKTSATWDVIECPATLNSKRDKIEFRINLRRKPLFFTVLLIIPTFVMGFLSTTAFYTPTGDMEKVTLAISITLALVVFLLLISKILPPASTIPLLAKFLLLTFTLNVMTILATVLVVHIYCRGPSTHRMPKWVRWLFLDIFASLLMMPRPKRHMKRLRDDTATVGWPSDSLSREIKSIVAEHNGVNSLPNISANKKHAISREDSFSTISSIMAVPLTKKAIEALEAIDFIAEHLQNDEEVRGVRSEWQYVSMVMDKLLLYVFLGVTLGGTFGIIFSSPTVFDIVNQEEVINRLKLKYFVS